MAEKLTTQRKRQVATYAKNSSDTQKAIADEFQISVSTVGRILKEFNVRRPKGRLKKSR